MNDMECEIENNLEKLRFNFPRLTFSYVSGRYWAENKEKKLIAGSPNAKWILHYLTGMY